VYDDYRYSYRQNGISFRVSFVGLNYDVQACKIHEGAGDYPLTGNNLQVNVTKLQNFGESLMFEPVPMEFLRSDAQTPQVIVTINGLEALCSNLNCDFLYTTPVPQIDSQTYT
jgi:hypothetical protein